MHRQLLTLFPELEPPQKLPPKAAISMLFGADASAVEKRRLALETYLQSILYAKDARWRRSSPWQTFLCVAENTGIQRMSGTAAESSLSNGVLSQRIVEIDARTASATVDNWIENMRQLQQLCNDMRAEINARERAAVNGQVGATHAKTVQLRKAASVAANLLAALENALTEQQKSPMQSSGAGQQWTKGELLRREDILANIKEELSQLTRLAQTIPTPTQKAAPESSERSQLLSSSDSRSQPPRSSRKFGQSVIPEETDKTRPLDNVGLLQLQQATMRQQEEELESLSGVIRRQREIGLSIGQELDLQNQMLDEVRTTVDRVETNLKTSDKKLSRILKK